MSTPPYPPCSMLWSIVVRHYHDPRAGFMAFLAISATCLSFFSAELIEPARGSEFREREVDVDSSLRVRPVEGADRIDLRESTTGKEKETSAPRESAPAKEKLKGKNDIIEADPDSLWSKYSNAGERALNHGDYERAKLMYELAMIEARRANREDMTMAATLNNLAEVARQQGRYKDAEQLYKQSLALKEKLCGPVDLSVAKTVNNLAILYMQMANQPEAEKLHKRALSIREKLLEPDDLTLASSLNNLAAFYDHNGRYAEAEVLYKKALAIKEKKSGVDSKETASCIGNLGLLYLHQARFDKAIEQYKRSGAIMEKAYGPDNTHVGTEVAHLAEAYRLAGNTQQAEQLMRRAMKIHERTLGLNHPQVASNLYILALLSQTQGNLKEAHQSLKRALAIRQRLLGPKHPDTKKAMETYASVLHKLNKHDEAIKVENSLKAGNG